jgi:hypothetical protein
MGKAASKPSNTCPDCNCDAEVPRVIAACNKAGSSGVSNTLEQTMTSLMGKENADAIMKDYAGALAPNSKWVSDYEKIAESFNNHEGFIEGMDTCVPCDCNAAANDIINECQKSTQYIQGAIDSTIKDGNIDTGTRDLLTPITDETNQIKQTNNDWKTIFYPSIKIKQSNKEGFIEGNEGITSTDLAQFTIDAVASRHATFRDSARYQDECRINAYTTMNTFIITERRIIQSLYDYYIAFTKDYASLYLHRESFAKAINNKLDELQRIQAKIDSYKTNLHVDNRKNLYQTSSYDFYTNIRLYILLVYYSAVIIYLIFSKFISEKQYTNKFLVLLLFIYLIMPIILAHLINFPYEGYIYFLEANNLKEDAKSYEDIIK